MMWQLLLGTVLMLALSVVFMAWPRSARAGEQQTPAQLFAERMDLLATARDAGELAEQDFDSAANELKQQFLEQEAKAVQLKASQNSWRWYGGLSTALLVMVAGIYSWNGHYRELADWQLAQQKLPEYGERALLEHGEPLSEQELARFGLALRTKLARDGDDAAAWFLLGRIWLSQGFMMDAIDAFEKALQMTPNRPALLISYSQALLVVGGDDKLAKAGRALARALTAEPDNLDALSLLAFVAYEKGDMAEAAAAWTILLDRLPTTDPRYAVVLEKLQALGHEVSVRQERLVLLTLDVDPSLRQQYPDASVFVFVRQPDGPALPVAAQRIPVPAGELQLMLTEEMAMQPGWTLASIDDVEVVARFSPSGSVDDRQGSFEVVSAPQLFSDGKVQVSLRLKAE
ncbi:c-type cytochrome biogenesis protein CcmI [Alkalimonas amylolytica]|uniref:Cytochrome c-type biogenesis protein CcmI n=1 Tax=Alkalimonas amylolytica TaxID=152573 RepID=A0A1H4BLJ0_ALKAM|nr:c-type cytochrome biogenesis protein CcmI [Alkalimonas amylolytica]SEA48692.1 cytochrome c-type biogenesis protein CcmI [Alkalimonas amylolytica]